MLVKVAHKWLLSHLFAVAACGCSLGQAAPATPDRPWTSPDAQQIRTFSSSVPQPPFTIDPNKAYSLPELVDLAEQHNPATSLAWERAKSQAAVLGIARSEWYPVLSAVAAAQVQRFALLFNTNFIRQTVSDAQPALMLNYTILDFGRRSARVEAAGAELLATDFGFNDTHRRIIYQVEEAYYRVLSTAAQQQAAEVSLLNAQTVQQSAEDRLKNGLATLPDVLEARSATAQAQFDLQSAIGSAEIARGDLATALGTSATISVKVEPITSLETPNSVEGTVEQLIDRALQQRPDLMQQVADLRARQAAEKEAKSAYYPTLSTSILAGPEALYGFQEQFPAAQTSLLTGSAGLTLNWTIFDGGARRSALARAEADSRAATSQINVTRNQIADEVWRAYSNVKTAFRQREAATALLQAAEQSYDAALEAYKYGVRNLLDVTAAQRALAQARSSDISAQTQVLTSLAELAFRTGDLLNTPMKQVKP
ncbi:MAG: TolC family protein [Candidatus Korobacteraceae bacterium]